MMAAAASGKLHALYVVGANPVKTFAVDADGSPGKLDLLVVQDLFLTETAKLADVFLPAASTYEKNGTMTNTAGEVQMAQRRRSHGHAHGLRHASHSFAPAWAAGRRDSRSTCAPPKRPSTKFASRSRDTEFRWPPCCPGEAEESIASFKLDRKFELRRAAGIDLFRRTIRCLPAARWAAIAPPYSLFPKQRMRWKRRRIRERIRRQSSPAGRGASKLRSFCSSLLTALAYLTWFERKVVAHIQSRWGPYRVGPHGLLQPLADGVKFLFKEDPTPRGRGQIRLFSRAVSRSGIGLYVHCRIPVRAEGIHGLRPIDAAFHHESEYRPARPVSRSLRWACMEWRWPAGRPTANILCWADCAAPRRWSATNFR